MACTDNGIYAKGTVACVPALLMAPLAADDFGDAPDSYQTLTASGGASHGFGGSPLYLGACVDDEAGGQPATAGNPATGDDEDGVVFGNLEQSQAVTATGLALVVGANLVNFNVPCASVTSLTYSRFQASTAGGLGPGDSASNGEVEDHDLTIIPRPVVEIPATSRWGLLLLALIVAVFAVRESARYRQVGRVK